MADNLRLRNFLPKTRYRMNPKIGRKMIMRIQARVLAGSRLSRIITVAVKKDRVARITEKIALVIVPGKARGENGLK